MPKRKDIRKILIIGSGPIVIGQACEFDYSGAQACKVLKAQGYKVVLVNSNPATIMTDPELAHRTYIEPITPEVVPAYIRPAGAGSDVLGRLSSVALRDVERALVENTLKDVGGNRERASQLLGISSRTLYRKIKEYGQTGPRPETP